MLSSSAAFKTTLTSFRLNNGDPVIPFHRRGVGRATEPGRHQTAESYRRATTYTGVLSPGLRGDGCVEYLDIKPHSTLLPRPSSTKPPSPAARLGDPPQWRLPRGGSVAERWPPVLESRPGTAGAPTWGERRPGMRTPRDDEAMAASFGELHDALKGRRSPASPVAPAADPLYHSAAPLDVGIRPPTATVDGVDLAGVEHRAPVRRYYTMNQLFYAWPLPPATAGSLFPFRPRTADRLVL